MARKLATPITITLSASSLGPLTLYVTDIQRSYEFTDFKRVEYSNKRYWSSIDSTSYAEPTIVKSATNIPIQIGIESPCGFANALNLGPEDNNLSNIYQRLNSVVYEITSSPSSPSSVNSLKAIADEHKRRKDMFDYYLTVRDENISYQLLQQLTGQNFNYLTTTGLTVVDAYDFGTITNCLIKEYSEGVVHTNPVTQTAITSDWKLTLEVITITTRATY